MLYRIKITIRGYHEPTKTWHPLHAESRYIRAVSVKHAFDKGLKIATALPQATKHENDPAWQVEGAVSIERPDPIIEVITKGR